MLEMFQLPFMLQALVACCLMSVVLAYFGLHVVMRGIVFIDLALAQIASSGAALAVLTQGHPALYSLGATLLGAVGLAALPSGNPRVPQEAIIGIIYAVASAVSILLLSKAPHGESDVTALLFGNILAVTPGQLVEMVIVFTVAGVLHAVFYKRFFGLHARPLGLWNLMFYLTLALVLSYAIRIAGVLLVFALLTVPAVSALLLWQNLRTVLGVAMGLGVLASAVGLGLSYVSDLPTGATIVAVLGGVLLCCGLLGRMRGGLQPSTPVESSIG